MTTQEAKPRYVPEGSCTWCGHKPHAAACTQKIRVGSKVPDQPCPCAKMGG